VCTPGVCVRACGFVNVPVCVYVCACACIILLVKQHVQGREAEVLCPKCAHLV